jgi:cell division protein FtsZ
MRGAKGVLINITGGYDMTLFELDEAANEIRREVDEDANIILGSTFDPELEGRVRVSVVAAGVTAQDVAVAVTPSAPAKPDVEAPVVVSQPAATAAEIDERPDFSGRALPAAHVEAQQGTDTVSADAAFTKPVSDSPAGFSNLFGWRREDAVGDNDSGQEETAIVSTPDDHPKPAAFDDEDLEIPAFLRRSANN